MTLIAIAWKHTCEEISKSNPLQFWMACSSPPDYIIFHWPHMLLSSVCFFCNNWSLYVQWSCPLKCFSQRVICFSVQGVILLTLFWIIQIAGFWKYTYYILLKAVGPSHPDFYLLPATVIGAKKHKSSIHKSGNIQIMSSLPAGPPPPHYLIFFRCCRRSQTLSSAVTDVKFHPTYVIFSFSTPSLNSSKNVFLSSF